ncbi:hypothetical protein [Nocardia wallacei]|uniref:hypothetical protein n=1 Tax=Nocardia wallacei TaxID=480035 RepID=UPI003CC7D1DC
MSAYHDDRDSYRRLIDRGERPTRRALRETIDAAARAGHASPDGDVDMLFEFLRGATFLHPLTRPRRAFGRGAGFGR